MYNNFKMKKKKKNFINCLCKFPLGLLSYKILEKFSRSLSISRDYIYFYAIYSDIWNKSCSAIAW